MTKWTIDELRELAPAYVMNTLDPNERAAFEAALASSPELAAEVADHRAVVEALATAQSISPPAALRNTLLERIAAERQARRQAATPISSARRRWVPAVVVTALAASLVVAIALQQRTASERDSALATLRARDSVLAFAQTRLAARDTEIETILTAERDLMVVHLASADAKTGPGVQLFWNYKEGVGVLHAFRLAPARAGRAYQLWLIKDGKPVPSRVFNSDPDGHGLVAGFDLPRDTKGVTALAITEEPAGGSQQPTTTPFLLGTVAH
jgi:anti-sigma-K factor RskA